MRAYRKSWVIVAAVAAVGAWFSQRGVTGVAAQNAPDALVATLRDQVDLAVTVYNSNIALVRDVRQVSLPSGTTQLHLADIAQRVCYHAVRGQGGRS